MKINIIVAIRCHILKLKCTKFDYGAGGAYSAPPDHLAVFRGPTCKGTGREKEGSGKGERGGEERKERGGERRGERGQRGSSSFALGT